MGNIKEEKQDLFCCDHAENALNNIPPDETVIDLSDFFKIFSDFTRVRLLFAIKDKELCVHDLSIILNMQQPAVSYQLKILKQYKIVSGRRSGKNTFYYLNDNHIFNILDIGLTHIHHGKK